MITTALPAYKYLIEQRKINEDTIRKFHLGYVDPNGEFYVGADFPSKFPVIPPKMLQQMSHGTLFPVFDLYNSCVAVSVRPLGPTQTKYINTHYEKSEHLYGLSVTAANCLQTQTAYVVEGNISLLQMYQAGVTNCVAMLGSKLSVRQICLLSRFVKKIVLVPDADKAGRKLVVKMRNEIIPEKLYDADVKFAYIELPDGCDPDDYFKTHTTLDFLSLNEREL